MDAGDLASVDDEAAVKVAEEEGAGVVVAGLEGDVEDTGRARGGREAGVEKGDLGRTVGATKGRGEGEEQDKTGAHGGKDTRSGGGLLIGHVEGASRAALPVHEFAAVAGLHSGAEADGALALDAADAVGIVHGSLRVPRKGGGPNDSPVARPEPAAGMGSNRAGRSGMLRRTRRVCSWAVGWSADRTSVRVRPPGHPGGSGAA